VVLHAKPIPICDVRRLYSLEFAEQGAGLGRIVTAPRHRFDDIPLPSYNLLEFGEMPFDFYQTVQKQGAGAIHMAITLALRERRGYQQRPRRDWPRLLPQSTVGNLPTNSGGRDRPALITRTRFEFGFGYFFLASSR
jgi:hypothetical protein